MVLNSNKLGIAAAIATGIYQLALLVLASIISMRTAPGLIGQLVSGSLINIPATMAVSYIYAFILGFSYNKLMGS